MSIVPDPPERPLGAAAHARRERQRKISDQVWTKDNLIGLKQRDMTDFTLLNGLIADSLKPMGDPKERMRLANRLREQGLAQVAKWDVYNGIKSLKQALATVGALLREEQPDTIQVGVKIRDFAPKETLLVQKKIPMEARELQLRLECDMVNARLKTLNPKRLSHSMPTAIDTFLATTRPPTGQPQLLASANPVPPTPLSQQRVPSPLVVQQPHSRSPSPWVGVRPHVPSLPLSRRATPLTASRPPTNSMLPPPLEASQGTWSQASVTAQDLAATNQRLLIENRELRIALENANKRERHVKLHSKPADFVQHIQEQDPHRPTSRQPF